MENIKRQYRNNSDELVLCLELPTFEHPVFFHEKELDVPSTIFSNHHLVTICDPELLPEGKESNPIDNKHLKLVFGNYKKVVDPDLRPSAGERDRIEKILNYPITKKLDIEDRNVLWKFRFHLTSNNKALTKFLRCVDWTNPQEVKHATELINQWEPIEISDALELLSKHFTHCAVVRDYAVSRLERASNEELTHYLLQLVQALRYDAEAHESHLGSFLISRAIPDATMRNFLYWYLRVECEDQKYKKFYQKKLTQFIEALETSGNKQLIQYIKWQDEILGWLSAVYKDLRAIKSKKQKMQKFHEMFQQTGIHANLGKFPFPHPLPLPLEPRLETVGITPVTIFSSSMEPLLINFRSTQKDKDFGVIYKSGDDLRQDQIIIQLISLMDNLLKKESLDLKLKPYRVLATGTKEGMLECVSDSNTITKILFKHADIHEYLRFYNKKPNVPYEIDPEVIDTFIRSCAGYCVITFVLCVGDRHLDNLLITTSGHLFHIDFGYIAHDPKPYPPPMKLCSEMIAAMGGDQGKDFELFKQLCVEAYNILRKNANLILNLISLMADANIPDFANERALLQIQEKFQLDKSDEEAGKNLQDLMQASVTALIPRISEAIHKWKQYWDSR